MDNIIITKIWNDSDIINNKIFQIKLTCQNEYITIKEEVYLDDYLAKKWAETIKKALKENKKYDYEVSMKKKMAPGFSMTIYPYDNHGHITIEMKMEIEDTTNKEHFACFYITTEIGKLEKFSNKIEKIINLEIDASVSLLEV